MNLIRRTNGYLARRKADGIDNRDFYAAGLIGAAIVGSLGLVAFTGMQPGSLDAVQSAAPSALGVEVTADEARNLANGRSVVVLIDDQQTVVRLTSDRSQVPAFEAEPAAEAPNTKAVHRDR